MAHTPETMLLLLNSVFSLSDKQTNSDLCTIKIESLDQPWLLCFKSTNHGTYITQTPKDTKNSDKILRLISKKS